MNYTSLYDKYLTRLGLTRQYWMGKSKTDSPLYIHGTFLEKLDSIWRNGIEPGGSVPPNDPMFVIPGYVSLQKIGYSAGSGHGNITLIIDGLDLDPSSLEFHVRHEHEIHRGIITTGSIMAIDIRDMVNARKIYGMTAHEVPIVRNTDELVLH